MAEILVVDDEESLSDLVATGLRLAGHSTTIAQSGYGALDAIARSTPDLVVLDVNLPDLDGFEVCRRLRSSGVDLPIIFLTARTDPADLRTGFTEGGDDYLMKPFRLEELALHDSLDYSKINSLSIESREKLTRLRPRTLGQASRISGVSPSDISVLLVHMGR